MIQVFHFLISSLSKIVYWVFSIEIIENPKITFGSFLLSCSIIGIAIFIIFGSNFLPGSGNFILSRGSKINTSKDNYKPRHSIGNAGKDYSTRESRHKY